MGLYELARSKPYKDFMAKLYGWGAAVVIGEHYLNYNFPGAGVMLTLGMGAESLIFFYVGFELLHVEYNGL